MKKIYKSLLFGVGLLFVFSTATLAAELVTEKTVQAQLDAAKNDNVDDPKIKALITDLEGTLALLADINKQKITNDQLKTQITNASNNIAASRSNIEKLRAQNEAKKADNFTKLSVNDLQTRLTATQQKIQQIQTELTALNSNLASQKSIPERTQVALTENLTRSQQVKRLLAAPDVTSALKTKYETELTLLSLKDVYNQMLLDGIDQLTTLYSNQLDEKNLVQQQLQAELSTLQSVINEKNLQESQNQLQQAAQSQEKNSSEDINPLIRSELKLNTDLSQELLNQTTQLNSLSQDNLQIKNVLDNLQQTQQNINEQISSLQGTLILSRIINKQKQLLPQDQMIKGLSRQITELRVRIFDLTEFRDEFSDISAYIADLELSEKITFTNKEKTQLSNILQERSKILSDLIKQLNSQLTLSINIELNQNQVQIISDTLQKKLQQQSFWVKSNPTMDLTWFKSFPIAFNLQLRDIIKKFDFSNWQNNVINAGLIVIFLFAIIGLILRKKEKIKQKLTAINNKMKISGSDSQWYTPKAIFWTIILCLPSTLMFLSIFILVSYIFFYESMEVWPWGFKMAGYWLYFAFMLALLRPNGIAYRHFKMPQQSAENFRKILKQSVWLVALLVNTSVFSNLDVGIGYDVIGEVLTISVLILTIFMIGPEFRRAIASYQNIESQNLGKSNYLLTFVRIVLLLAPIVLIVLIVIGYYYTSLVLIEHLISSYFAFTTWLLIRNLVYRGFEVSSRRLAARRLKEKREQIQAKINASEEQRNGELSLEFQQDNNLAISKVKDQVLAMVDFLLWVGLFGLFYWVWSDLITVAYYLDGVTLWQQIVATDKGMVTEAVTLLNVLIAIIIIVVTYVLIRNIGGLLEVLVFSHVKLSQGTPYTVTTLLTYLIIAIGAAVAFGILGMSWSKLQWLFAALSVGLGFGMQEIFANFVSGIIILFERPIRIGDTITIDTFSGTVSKIRIRATTLIDFDKKEVIVPNKAFVTERLVNWALTDSMTRLIINVGVAYGSDLELVKKLLLQAAEENELILKDPKPVAFFLTFAESTLNHELRVYVGDLESRHRAIDGLNRRIDQLFRENNVEIAFNQLDVYIKNQITSEEVKLGSKKNSFTKLRNQNGRK